MLKAWLERLTSDQYVDRSIKFRHIHQMIERLNLAPLNSIVISIAGTNGKGSCVALLESIYTQAGYRVGAFTSPHLLEFNERIRICQHNVSDEEIYEAFEKIEKARGDLQIGYFQFAFLAALMMFQKLNLDVILLEVGIGGLYDAVNVVDSDLSIITQLGLDHCALLGDTRELIAEQKAGIMRQKKPVICGDCNPPKVLIDIAKKLDTKLFCIQRDFDYKNDETNWSWSCENKTLSHLPRSIVLLQNSSTALMAIECLQTQLTVSEAAIKKGIRYVQLLGRRQLAKFKDLSLLLDVAHNIDAVSLLVEKIQQLKCQGKVRLVFGVMTDKDYQSMLSVLSGCVDDWYISPLPSQRSLSVDALRSNLSALNIANYKTYQAPIEAFDDAVRQSGGNDLIVVCGSFLTVASVLEKISGSIVENRSC